MLVDVKSQFHLILILVLVIGCPLYGSCQARNGYDVNAITVAGGNGKGLYDNQLDITWYNGVSNEIASSFSGICGDNRGNIYVSDCGNFRIMKWHINEEKGEVVGRNLPEITPSGLFISGDDLYISAGGLDRIFVYDVRTGQFETRGLYGQGPQNFSNPHGIYVDKFLNMYVADSDNDRIQKWSKGADRGATVAGGNGEGSLSNQFSNPNGIFVDSFGDVFIVDLENDRVQEWPPGAKSAITVAGGNGKGSGANQFDTPSGIVGDDSGNIYVVDEKNNRVQLWLRGEKKGITVAGGYGRGSLASQLNQPTGIWRDALGNLFVVDNGNSRVQEFKLDRDSRIPKTDEVSDNQVNKVGQKDSNIYKGRYPGPMGITPISSILTTLTWLQPSNDSGRLPDGVLDVSASNLPISVRINSTAPIEQSKVEVLLNGVALSNGDKMRVVSLKALKTSNRKYEYDYSTSVTVPEGRCSVQVVYGEDVSDVLSVNFSPQSLNLFILSIGTNSAGLRYSQKDALDFAALFGDQQGDGKLFRQVNIQTIVGTAATAVNLADKIYQLSTKEYNANDVIFIFLSSHGFVEDGSLKIAGSDYKAGEANLTTLDFQQNILVPLQNSNCKKFVFLDACHSGAGIKSAPGDVANAIKKMISADNSITIITSSAGDEQSWEDASWQNGAFTKAIKEALTNGKCDTNGDGIITIEELFAYLKKRVPELVTNAGKTDYGNHPATQTPTMFNPKGNVGIFVY